MTSKIWYIFVVVLLFSSLLFNFGFIDMASATGTADCYLIPSSNIDNGETFTVTCYIDPSVGTVYTMKASTEFSNSLMTVDSVSAGNVAGGIAMAFDAGTIDNLGGTVNYTQYMCYPATSQNYSWFVYTCSAIAEGTAYVNFTYVLLKDSAMDDVTEVYHNVSFTIGASVPAPGNPTGVSVLEGESWLNVTWTTGANADTTRIESNSYNDSSWPPGDHTLRQNSSAEYYNMSVPSFDTTVYFKLWSFNTSGGGYSSGVTRSGTTGSYNNPPTIPINFMFPTNNSYPGWSYSDGNVLIDALGFDSDDDLLTYTFYNRSGTGNPYSELTTIYNKPEGEAVEYMWTGLDYNTTYNWSVNVTDGIDTFGTTWICFTTPMQPSIVVNPPTNLYGIPYSDDTINLSWTKGGSGVDKTVICGHTQWPQNPNDHKIYNGTGVTFNHTGLNSKTRYYYIAWSWNETNNSYSQYYDSTSVTTGGPSANISGAFAYDLSPQGNINIANQVSISASINAPSGEQVTVEVLAGNNSGVLQGGSGSWDILHTTSAYDGMVVSYLWQDILGHSYWDGINYYDDDYHSFSYGFRVVYEGNSTTAAAAFYMPEPQFLLFGPEPANGAINETPYTLLSVKAYQECGGNITARFSTSSGVLIGVDTVEVQPFDTVTLSTVNDYATGQATTYSWHVNATLTIGTYKVHAYLPGGQGDYSYTTMDYDLPTIIFSVTDSSGNGIDGVSIRCPGCSKSDTTDANGLCTMSFAYIYYLSQEDNPLWYGYTFYFNKTGYVNQSHRIKLPFTTSIEQVVLAQNITTQIGNTSSLFDFDWLTNGNYSHIFTYIQDFPPFLGLFIMLGLIVLVAMGTMSKSPMAMGIGIVSILVLGVLIGWIPWWVLMVVIFAGGLGGYAFFQGKLPGLTGGG